LAGMETAALLIWFPKPYSSLLGKEDVIS